MQSLRYCYSMVPTVKQVVSFEKLATRYFFIWRLHEKVSLKHKLMNLQTRSGALKALRRNFIHKSGGPHVRSKGILATRFVPWFLYPQVYGKFQNSNDDRNK
jgi:hypothetical protein